MGPSVNKPTDTRQKEADVNRKLQIYGIISAFKAGKVPSVRASLCCHDLASSVTLTHDAERPN
jgi:hypothetical protein